MSVVTRVLSILEKDFWGSSAYIFKFDREINSLTTRSTHCVGGSGGISPRESSDFEVYICKSLLMQCNTITNQILLENLDWLHA